MPFRFSVERTGFNETRAELDRIRKRADEEVYEATRDMVDRVWVEMRQTINRSEGQGDRGFHTYETIEHDTERRGFAEAEGVAGTSDHVALILQYGSRPHVIEPKQARALRFFWKGEMRFFRKVNHPGTRAYRWMDRSMVLADAYNRQRWHKAARRILYGEEF